MSTKLKNPYILLLLLSTISLFFAYFVEYSLKHLPCNLCLIERVPYMLTIILSFLVLILSKYERVILVFIGLFFVFGTFVSFYHFGIEQGFFNESLVCELSGISVKPMSAEELLKELGTERISCKNVTFRIFGISLATLNTITSLVVSVIIFRTVINYEKN